MKTLLLTLLLVVGSVSAAPLPTFLVRCTGPICPIVGKQELRAKKIQTTGSTTTGAGMLVDRAITFKCPKCGKFIMHDKVLVPVPEPPVEIKKRKTTLVTTLNAKNRKERVMLLPPTLPPPPARKAAKPQSHKAAKPRTETVAVKVTRPPRTIASFSNAHTRVIYGALAKTRSAFTPAGTGTGPPKELLPVSIYYENDVPVDVFGKIVISDIVTIIAQQQPHFGVIIEYSDNLRDWATTFHLGTYPEAQPVSIAWIRPDSDVHDFYPKVFFRAYKD